MPTTLWIPERPTTDVAAARFSAHLDASGVRLDLELTQPDPGATAIVYRSTSEAFESRAPITAQPVAFTGGSLAFLDRDAEPATTYWYWVQVRTGHGTTFMNGPVNVTTPVSTAITFVRGARPNPVRRSTELEFTIGADAAVGGAAKVSLAVRDVQGRVIRQLVSGPMPVGVYHVGWDATDRTGVRVRPGAYYLSLDAGSIRHTQRLTVID